jgi:type II secretory pathway predicted ATPase ExeA
MSMEHDNRALGAMVMEAAQREAGLRSHILQQKEEIDRLLAELAAKDKAPVSIVEEVEDYDDSDWKAAKAA